MTIRHVFIVLGTRPEAIKLAPLVLALRDRRDRFQYTIVGTGQQREMLPQALAEFGLAVDHNLAVMMPNQPLAGLTARLLDALDPLIVELQPDWVVVQGDTTTAMVGALVAFYRRVPVAHVEAGLRTYNRFAPYPEEVNRRVISSVADLHFAVTQPGRQRLLAEGIPDSDIHVVGNTGIDALLWVRRQLSRAPSPLPASIDRAIAGKRVILVTGHRRENFDRGIEQICFALCDIAATVPEVVIVYPVHLNPNIQEPVRRILAGRESIVLTDPLSYRAFVGLMDRATLIVTDSGGIQEEAPSLGKPVLVMRETTERPEGVAVGNAVLVGADRERIVSLVRRLLTDSALYEAMTGVANPYGDGQATRRIVDVLSKPA